MVHRHHSWVGPLIALLPWKLAQHLPVLKEASPQEGDFQVRFSSDHTDPMSKAYCVFNNRDLTLASEKQPRTMEISYIVWGSQTTLICGPYFYDINDFEYYRMFLNLELCLS